MRLIVVAWSAALASGCLAEPPRPLCSAPRALAELNQDVNDTDPWLAEDRSELLFSSQRAGVANGYQLWRATRDNHEAPFAAPRQLAGDFVTDGDVRGPSLSDDGLRLYYSKSTAGAPPAIWMATRDQRSSDRFTTRMMVVDAGDHASLTTDELTIYFAKDDHLYRATRASESAPFVNATRLDELVQIAETFPAIDAHDTTLLYTRYLASGVFEIVRSRRGSSVFEPPEPVAATKLPDPAANLIAPRVHRDGATIVFSSDVTGGSATTDLFITCE